MTLCTSIQSKRYAYQRNSDIQKKSNLVTILKKTSIQECNCQFCLIHPKYVKDQLIFMEQKKQLWQCNTYEIQVKRFSRKIQVSILYF
ncbi:unnamed protein product [Paramecium sonneborni]|uniref:Uncharacterized protein n=1 Tax=Paramecium sonneborni TaxID=65129 RepID=A0A8S1R341_9CILI|nr:unnamed protein product [Paramecium sonneborni]